MMDQRLYSLALTLIPQELKKTIGESNSGRRGLLAVICKYACMLLHRAVSTGKRAAD